MEWASYFISQIHKYLNHCDDTSIDRLNRLYTVALLSAFVTLISTQQYVVGGHIICWTPTDFTGAHNIYTHNICWLGQTNYYIPENFTTLYNPSNSRTYPFLIYPWLPIILIGMTVCFIAPYLLIWHGLSTRSEMDIKRFMKIDKQDELILAINYILLKRYLLRQSRGIYVIRNYFDINLQESLKILSIKYNMWSSAHFPIETMCDFMVRMLGQNNNWYTVQCILPYNLFTKRIFALLTIWFIILLIINLIDLIFIWLYKRVWLSSHRYQYILNLFDLYEKYLQDNYQNPMIISAMDEEKYCQEFVYEYLGIDGYLLLKLLHPNNSNINMSHLVVNLFERFIEEKESQSKRLIKHNHNTVV